MKKDKVRDRYVRYISLLSYLTNRTTVPIQPIIWIEPTNACNFHCSICPVNSLMKRKKGFMKEELFKKIINEAKTLNVKEVSLTNWGEPLLHPQICEFIRFAKQNGLKTRITTNGSLLNEEKSKQLLDSGLDTIIFSIYGIKEDYEKITKRNYEEIKEKCVQFINMRDAQKARTKIFVRHTITDDTEKNINKFKDEWGGLCDALEFQQQTVFGSKMKSQRKNKCPQLWSSLIILWDGSVVPCCADFDGTLYIGDANTENIKRIWNGPLIKKLRRAHIDKKFPPTCIACIERTDISEVKAPIPARFKGFGLSDIPLGIIKYVFKKRG